MVKAYIYILIIVFIGGLAQTEHTSREFSEDSELAGILELLGDEPVPHKPNMEIEGVSAKRGEQLVRYGIAAKESGGKTAKQSAHFVCTSCHNIEREDPDLANPNPEDRLAYVADKGLPFLQGSPFYGIVNRTSFYNDDYYKKYGALVDEARNSIRDAIQLCAVECAQGRSLKDWEIESILAYFWRISLKVKDLQLSEEEQKLVQQAVEQNINKEEALALLKTKYMVKSPAHMERPPDDRREGYEAIEGDPNRGKLIYDLSCKHCHYKERYSFFALDDAKDTFRFLTKHFPKYTRYSIYQVSRWGTSPMNGKRAYMPFYTQEKMSNQQMEDLRAYIQQEAK